MSNETPPNESRTDTETDTETESGPETEVGSEGEGENGGGSGGGLSEERVEELAREDANLKIEAADADAKSDALREAFVESYQQFKSLTQQHQEAISRRDQLQEWIRTLTKTIDRLERIGDDPDRLVLRDLPHGTTVEIPPDEREANIDDYREDRSEFRERLPGAERTVEKAASKRRIVAATLNELERRADASTHLDDAVEDELGETEAETIGESASANETRRSQGPSPPGTEDY